MASGDYGIDRLRDEAILAVLRGTPTLKLATATDILRLIEIIDAFDARAVRPQAPEEPSGEVTTRATRRMLI